MEDTTTLLSRDRRTTSETAPPFRSRDPLVEYLHGVWKTVCALVLGMGFTHLALGSSGLLFDSDRGASAWFPNTVPDLLALPSWLCAMMLLLAAGLAGMIGLTVRHPTPELKLMWIATALLALAGTAAEASAPPSLLARALGAGNDFLGTRLANLLLLILLSGLLGLGAVMVRAIVPTLTPAIRQDFLQAGGLLALGTGLLAMAHTGPSPQMLEIGSSAWWITLVQGLKLGGALLLLYALTGSLCRAWDARPVPVPAAPPLHGRPHARPRPPGRNRQI